MKLLGIFIIVNEHKQYTEYKRQKVSILDVIADISALFSTVFGFFLFGFQFYSKNYDNYKIIENILSEKQSKIIKRTTQIELGDQINETNSKIEESIERGKSDLFIPSDKNEIKEDDEKKDIKKETNLEKPSFRHFLFNNFYCDCLKFKKEHKIIELCNEIFAKYYSIELILYNQILFENLIRDYKWNDPELRNVESNELLYKIKNIG